MGVRRGLAYSRHMGRVIQCAVAAVTLVALGAPAAHAQEKLGEREAGTMVALNLKYTIVDAVDPYSKTPRVRVGECETAGNRGTCRASMVSSHFRCRGTFRVVEHARVYSVWPLRMDCARL